MTEFKDTEMTIKVPAFVHAHFSLIGSRGTPEDRASEFLSLYLAKDIGDVCASERKMSQATMEAYWRVFELMQDHFNERAKTDPAMMAARHAQEGTPTQN